MPAGLATGVAVPAVESAGMDMAWLPCVGGWTRGGSAPGLAHDPLWPEDQEYDQGDEDQQVGDRAREQRRADRLDETQCDGTQDRARDHASTADHDHDEGLGGDS